MSLPASSAWAHASGLAEHCDVSLLVRLLKRDVWLEALVVEVLARCGPGVDCDRPIRIVDGSVACLAG